jgi:hypothetical protein
VFVEGLIQSRVERMRGEALRCRSCVATHIEVCFACRRRFPSAIGDRVVRGPIVSIPCQTVTAAWQRNGCYRLAAGIPEAAVCGEALSNGHSAATKAPKPLERRGVAIGATTSNAVLLSLEQEQAMRAAESTQLGGHPL